MSRTFCKPDAAHLVGAPLGAAPHVGRVLGQRADARNGEQRLQLVEVAIAVDVDEVDDLVHHQRVHRSASSLRTRALRASASRGARARSRARPAAAPGRDHHRWIRRSPARCRGRRRAPRAPAARAAPMVEVAAAEDRPGSLDLRAVRGKQPRRRRARRSRSSDCRYWPRSPPLLALDHHAAARDAPGRR